MHRFARLVQQPEILAVELEVRGVLAREHGVRLRPGGDENRPGRKLTSARTRARRRRRRCDAAKREARRRARCVDFDADRRQSFGKADPLLQRLLDFLVVQRVRRAVDQPAAIGDRRAAPPLQQLDDPRFAPLPRAVSRSARIARACARNSTAISRSAAVHADSIASRPFSAHERLVAQQEFLDLHRVIRERLGRRVDRRQPAADDDHRQPELHVGHRVRLRRAGELQRHQEIRRRAHAGREPVRQFEHRRLARARRDRDVVEATRERAVGIERPAEAHAAEEREALATLEQQPDDLQEVLVPAHGDPVLGDAAESGHHAIVERLVQMSRHRRRARTARARRPRSPPTAPAAAARS